MEGMTNRRLLVQLRWLLLALMLTVQVAYAAPGERVDINTADAATLDAVLDRIGPAKAAAIVAWREENGPFRTVDDLLQVKGIGEKTLALNRDRVEVRANVGGGRGGANVRPSAAVAAPRGIAPARKSPVRRAVAFESGD